MENTEEVEALQAQLKEAEEKNTALWDKIYKLKKDKKEVEIKTETTWLTETDIDRIMSERDFYKSNPWLVEHKDTITQLTSWWVSLDEAKSIIWKRDSTIVARQNTQQSNFTAWEAGLSNSFTQEQTAQMSANDYAKFLTDYKAGKVKII